MSLAWMCHGCPRFCLFDQMIPPQAAIPPKDSGRGKLVLGICVFRSVVCLISYSISCSIVGAGVLLCTGFWTGLEDLSASFAGVLPAALERGLWIIWISVSVKRMGCISAGERYGISWTGSMLCHGGQSGDIWLWSFVLQYVSVVFGGCVLGNRDLPLYTGYIWYLPYIQCICPRRRGHYMKGCHIIGGGRDICGLVRRVDVGCRFDNGTFRSRYFRSGNCIFTCGVVFIDLLVDRCVLIFSNRSPYW